MLSHSPLPIYLCSLILFLPGIWLCGRKLASITFSQPVYIKLTSPLLAALLWLLCVHSIGLLTHNFLSALILGSVLPATYGYLFCRFQIVPRNPAQPRESLSRPIVWAAFIGTVWILPAVIFWDFHDKLFVKFGHFSIANHILNGVYPPRDFVYPQYEMHYHYGVDTLFAMLSAVTRLSVPIVIDLATVISWWYSLVLFGLIADTLCAQKQGKKAGAIGVIVGGFGGGIIWFLASAYDQPIAAAQYLIPFLSSNHLLSGSGAQINHPLASYIFQHPWTLGLPIFLTVLLVWSEVEQKNRPAIGATMSIGLCLLVLSFSQAVLFFTLSASILGVIGFRLLHLLKTQGYQQGQLTAPWLILCGVIISTYLALPFISTLLGGGIGTTNSTKILYSQYGIAGNFEANVLWHLAVFGLLLPMGLVGIFFLQNLRLLLTLLLIGSMIVFNFFQHEYSHNIVKFATVAQIVLSITSVAVIVRLLDQSHKAMRVIVAVLLLALINAGIGFHLLFWFNQSTMTIAQWRLQQYGYFTVDDTLAVSWLRRYIAADEIVLCPSPQLAESCSIEGGFPLLQPHMYVGVGAGHNPNPQELDQRYALYNQPNYNFYLYAQKNVRWAIISARSTEWQPIFQRWEQQGYAKLVMQFGDVSIFRLAPLALE